MTARFFYPYSSQKPIQHIDLDPTIHYKNTMSVPKRYTYLGRLAGQLYKVYSTTWTYDVIFPEGSTPFDYRSKDPKQSIVVGHWHGDDLAQISFCRYAKYLAMASRSKDGSIMAAALETIGLHVARGSSSRGGTRALVSMIRKIKEEHFYVAFAMDGPTGPRHRAKPGIHTFAAKTRLPIYQCLASCQRKWVFTKTWHKTYLPVPFSRIRLFFYELPPARSDNRKEILDLLDSRTAAPEEF
jgi:lysophospholipid acyltransferase (LPLAT)-like uncharacterized protein